MKLAPVWRALGRHTNVHQTIIHTGQHYDVNMSDVFFHQLEIPAPDLNLAVGPGTQARQTAEIMIRLEPVIADAGADFVLLYGDVNSTMAAALVCAKLGVKTAHVEAGLRSFDRTMPEEINRLVTDQLADLLFTPSDDADLNLGNEGVSLEKIFRVGNVMIDSLIRALPLARQLEHPDLPKRFALVTLHRPSNVDDDSVLEGILKNLSEVSETLEMIFPAHPRTRKRIENLRVAPGRLRIFEPLAYIPFLALQLRATVVITDSGGIQEETTFLGVPCLTMRDNTERPITVGLGTNTIVGRDPTRLRSELSKILSGQYKQGAVPPLWDGSAGERIAAVLTGTRSITSGATL